MIAVATAVMMRIAFVAIRGHLVGVTGSVSFGNFLTARKFRPKFHGPISVCGSPSSISRPLPLNDAPRFWESRRGSPPMRSGCLASV